MSLTCNNNMCRGVTLRLQLGHHHQEHFCPSCKLCSWEIVCGSLGLGQLPGFCDCKNLRVFTKVSIVILQIVLGSKSTTVAVCRPDNKQNRCGLGKNVDVRSSSLEEVRH